MNANAEVEVTARASATSRPGPVVRAAIDAGSNSVHLLVAVVDDHRVLRIADQSTFHALGAAAAAGSFGPRLIEELTATITAYVLLASNAGADTSDIVIAGTEPFRRAADAGAAIDSVRRATGRRTLRLTHVEEALLTLLGVMGGHAAGAETLVCDIGGGSTELAIAGPTHHPRAFGIRAGSASLTDQYIRHDPPTASELREVRAAAATLLLRAPRTPPQRVVAVGGSATNLLRVLPSPGRVLARETLQAILDVLATERVALAAERHRVNPVRARLLPAGAAILDAILERYGVIAADVVDAGVREGIVLAASRQPRSWRRDLRTIASGW